MKLTDGDLRHLFRFGMAMQKLDERDESLWLGIASPHPENRDWINLWITDEMNTVIPREVEPDDLGGYTFVDPWGGRRRIFPLSESRRVTFGAWKTRSISGFASPANTEPSRPLAAASPGTDTIEPKPPAPEMQYFLVHYASNGYPWGVWSSPADRFYGDDAHPSAVQHGESIMAGRDEGLSWEEWVDFLSWHRPVGQDRWDMFKTTEPEQLGELLTRLRGGVTYAQWARDHRSV